MNPNTQPDPLTVIRQRLHFLQTAAGAPPAARTTTARAVHQLDERVDEVIARQTWQPGNPEHGNALGRPLTHAQFTIFTHYFGPVTQLVRAYCCPFSRHYQQPAVWERFLAGLRFGERYVRPEQPRDGSWYMWDIGFPTSLSLQLLLGGDQVPPDLRAQVVADLEHMPAKVFTLDRQQGIVRPPITSGSNNLEVLFVGLLRGVLLNDPQWLDTVMKQVPIAMGRATGSEGLQADWSYHFHGHGVNAGYGLISLASQATWLYLTQGTPWQLPDAVRELHVGMIREFFARNTWRGRVAPYSLDRGVASPGTIYGHQFLTAILLGLQTELPAADKAVMAASATDYLQSLSPDGTPAFRAGLDAGEEMSLLPSLLLGDSPDLTTADPAALDGLRYYPDSEYLLVRQPGWFVAARMSSSRTSTWKSMLGAHIHGSSGAEFSVVFMTDGREFDHTTIPTMNWKRLMGVTRCDAIEPPPEGYGQSAFCGGVAGDELAVLGLQYLLAPAGQDTLRANKSLFAFPQALVLLGSRIRCDAAEPVVTTLFHAPWIAGAAYRRNGARLDLDQDGVWDIPAGETLHLRNVQVRLLTDARLIVETRRGSHADLNRSERPPELAAARTVYERRWIYLVVDHGRRPTNARYGVIIAPGELPADLEIRHEDDHHRLHLAGGSVGGEVRFPGDWRRPIGCSYWGAEQHQWGSIARWTPADDAAHAMLEITAPRRFVRSEQANTEIFLPAGLELENVTLKTYAGDPFPAHILPTSANGKTHRFRVRRVSQA